MIARVEAKDMDKTIETLGEKKYRFVRASYDSVKQVYTAHFEAGSQEEFNYAGRMS